MQAHADSSQLESVSIGDGPSAVRRCASHMRSTSLERNRLHSAHELRRTTRRLWISHTLIACSIVTSRHAHRGTERRVHPPAGRRTGLMAGVRPLRSAADLGERCSSVCCRARRVQAEDNDHSELRAEARTAAPSAARNRSPKCPCRAGFGDVDRRVHEEPRRRANRHHLGSIALDGAARDRVGEIGVGEREDRFSGALRFRRRRTKIATLCGTLRRFSPFLRSWRLPAPLRAQRLAAHDRRVKRRGPRSQHRRENRGGERRRRPAAAKRRPQSRSTQGLPRALPRKPRTRRQSSALRRRASRPPSCTARSTRSTPPREAVGSTRRASDWPRSCRASIARRSSTSRWLRTLFQGESSERSMPKSERPSSTAGCAICGTPKDEPGGASERRESPSACDRRGWSARSTASARPSSTRPSERTTRSFLSSLRGIEERGIRCPSCRAS